MTDDLKNLIEPVAKFFLGDPNLRLSSKTELRFGNRGSMSVDLRKGTWFDNELGKGGGVLDLVTRETGLEGEDRIRWMDEHGFEFERENGRAQASSHSRIVSTYDYVDEHGKLLFQVVRFDPKDFRQRKPDTSSPQGWSWSVRGVPQVPYKLPELIEAISNDSTIYIVEGEKDAERLWRLGIPATTNAAGAGKWNPQLNTWFEGADVVIVADNDPQKKNPKTGEPMVHPDGRPVLPGQDHARAVAEQLKPIARNVRVLHMPQLWAECPPKGDISDYLDAGGYADHLQDVVSRLPSWSTESQVEMPGERLKASVYIFPDPNDIPRRQWLYGNHYMRGVTTATVAPGGFGKTTLAIYEALEMVNSGKRVWYISGEDDLVEIDRRIAAHVKHNGDLQGLTSGGALYVDDKMSFPFKIAKVSNKGGGPVFDEEGLRSFEGSIEREKIDVVILDPFIAFHLLPENDTAAMDLFVKRLAEISTRRQCCIELSHHVRKPGMGQHEITVHDARGAGAIVNAVRSCRVLNQMTSLEAEQSEIEDAKRTSYIRVDNGKRNYTPPEKAIWMHLVNIEIANGDRVQAMERWDFPKAFGKLTVADLDWIKGLLRVRNYRADSRSPDWLGHVLCERFNRDSSGDNKGDIKWANNVLSTWVKTGVIAKKSLEDKDRKERVFYVSAEPRGEVIQFPEGGKRNEEGENEKGDDD